jgi:hypothetical protein
LGIEIGRRSGAHRDAARLDAAMTGVDILMPRQIGRIGWGDGLAGMACEP